MRQFWKFLLLAMLAFFLTLGLPTLANEASVSGAIEVQSDGGNSWLQHGIDRYEAQQFSEAAIAWEQSAYSFSNQNNGLGEALALSNLSLAYQQLGRWEEAETAIERSLNRLQALDSSKDDRAAIWAKALNTQGRLHWMRGSLEAARSSWEAATRYYVQAGDANGVAIAQINQAKAMQALGLSRDAADLLQQIYQSLEQQSDSDFKAIELRNLGSALRQIGDLDASREILTKSLELAQQPQTRHLARLALGNTERALANRAMALGKTDEATVYRTTALELYQQAQEQLQAQLNHLSLLVEMGKSEDALALWQPIEQSIEALPPSREAIEARLNLAQSLICLHPMGEQAAECGNVGSFASTLQTPTQQDIAQLLTISVRQAGDLQDARSQSYAIGQLARLYELTDRSSEAQTLTQQALLTAEAVSALDIRYRWEWQLGRLAAKQGERKEAIGFYQTATNTLQSVRRNLLSIDPEVQFSFRDRVEPLYREFVNVLLSGENGTPPSGENLQQAIRSIDALQLAELEDFLSCRLAALGELELIDDPQAATIYPIVLADRFAIVYQIPGQPLGSRETLVPQTEVEATLRALRRDLMVAANTPEVLESAEKVYQWLIKPIEPLLAQSDRIETLVFVLDGFLRNIPMSVLYDGEEYLIEKGYGIAVAPRLQLFRPQSSPEKLVVNTGGIGVPQTIDNITFPEIAKLTEELDRIAERVDASEPLLDEAFTTANIQQQLQRDRFSAIHWKTHGIFSSDPEETYIVAYNERIKARDLNALIQTGSRRGDRPLELLVLSACETAEGDDRAVLGLAGIAVRTGARSVVSTLWTARDAPNTEFMARFYEELAGGATKAQAVRRSQLALIQEYGYTTPHIWATYVLVGTWL